MEPIELLRRLLDERGVEWFESVTRKGLTWIYRDGKVIRFHPWQPDTLKVSMFDLTPEQAVEATLGPLTERAAKDSEKDSDGRGECHNEGDQRDFLCSECGARMYIDTGETYTMIDSLENIIEQPRFCPNCGCKIKED